MADPPKKPVKPASTQPFPVVRDARDLTKPTEIVPPPKPAKSMFEDLREIKQPLVTEGMKAHRRQVEKKKRAAAAERLRMDAERSMKWERNQKWVLSLLVIGLAAYGYWQIQSVHGNKWPLFTVWLLVCVALIAGFGWALWYIDSGE